MNNRIEFQFDDGLDHQNKAIQTVVDLFKGVNRQEDNAIYRNINRIRKSGEGDPVRNPQIVTGTRLLQNLRNIQLQNKLFSDHKLMNNNFTIEMETGTGKTYVYLRSILELYRIYGFNKFMIVVPSIAIRKGVEKSIEMLVEHFKTLYDGLNLLDHSFVYDSTDLQKISTNFVEKNDLSIVVMNIQAFNRESNKLRQEDEYGQVVWEDIKYINPIVIIDEPQKMEGSSKKKSASLEAIEMINPLFILRYSATHKNKYNQVYKLDSYEAYQSDLVKKIEVKTIHGTIPKDFPYIRYVEFTKDLYAKIEIFHVEQGGVIRNRQFNVRRNANLFELSGDLEQYKNIKIQEDPHKQKKLKIGTNDHAFELAIGENNSNINESETIRIQIRIAIKTHLEKQLNILRRGYNIKILTLFFIDAVSKVRDSSEADGRGEYLRIFDEEYAKIVEDSRWNELFRKYPQLFKGYNEINKVREGYFAVDKNKKSVEIANWGSIMDEEKLKKKDQEDVDRGIELILEKKDELISFEEPLAFIFSHSALREGWDNPNVFTICTLKRGGSDMAKKQEIGRGLRLPVDINGSRIKDSNINELSVIANDYYDKFAAALQRDFNEQIGFDKDEVTSEIIQKALKQAGIPDEKVTAELVDIFKDELLKKKIISEKNTLTKTAKEIRDIEFDNEILREHSQMIKEKFIENMVEKGTKKIPIKNGDDDPVINGQHSFITEDIFKNLLKELSFRMAARTMYKVKIDHAAFINACIDELNDLLRYNRVLDKYEIETGKATFNDQEKFILNDAVNQYEYAKLKSEIQEKSDFEIVNYIMYHTMLPRLAIYKIISVIEKKALLSNQDILDVVTQLIKKKLIDFKAKGEIEYQKIDGYVFSDKTIFEADSIDNAMLEDSSTFVYPTKENKRKALHKYYKLDSAGEQRFAEALDIDDHVLLYTKIKKGGFVIETPYGEYSPDWAVIYRGENNTAKLYFIIETKIDKEWNDLSDVEQCKIKCGELHFRAVYDDTEFHWANSYNHFEGKTGK